MTKRERVAISVIIGCLAGWLVILETGLAGDVGAFALWLVLPVCCVFATWWALGLVEAG